MAMGNVAGGGSASELTGVFRALSSPEKFQEELARLQRETEEWSDIRDRANLDLQNLRGEKDALAEREGNLETAQAALDQERAKLADEAERLKTFQGNLAKLEADLDRRGDAAKTAQADLERWEADISRREGNVKASEKQAATAMGRAQTKEDAVAARVAAVNAAWNG